jgi:hypothetical protein
VKVSKKIGMALLYDQPSAGSERKNTIQDQTCDNVPSGRGCCMPQRTISMEQWCDDFMQ